MKALPFTIPSVENSSFLVQEDRLEGFYPYLHRHEEVQICWIKKGKGTLIVQAEVFEFEEGDIFVIASNKAHLFKNEISDEGIESISLFFGLSEDNNPLLAIPELKTLFHNYSQLAPCNRISAGLLSKYRLLLDKLLKSDQEERLIQYLTLLNSLVNHLDIEKNFVSPYSEKDGDRMKKIMMYTLDNLSEVITIGSVAQEIAYTPEAFCRFFKKRTNKTYIQYLNELRINEACRKILAEEDPNIAKVAFECGYNNVSHFNRVFKAIKGSPPLRFKRNMA